jgi:TrpR family transcriptional regulator, trp operon repressor
MGAKRPKLMPLERALTVIRSRADAKQLLSVLLSPHEIESVNKRWLAFQMVIAGKPHRVISKKLHISIATVSRASRAVAASGSVVKRVVARFG